MQGQLAKAVLDWPIVLGLIGAGLAYNRNIVFGSITHRKHTIYIVLHVCGALFFCVVARFCRFLFGVFSGSIKYCCSTYLIYSGWS